MKKIICLSVCICLLAALISGCALEETSEETETVSSLILSIDLPKSMKKASGADTTSLAMAYVDKNCQFTLLAEDKEEIAAEHGALTLEQYAALVMESKDGATKLTESTAGNLTITFEDTDEDTQRTYCVFMESEDSFLILQFTCLAQEYEKYFDAFQQWEASVVVYV